MPQIQSEYRYVVVDDDGVPVIADTTMKVSELVLEHTLWRWDAGVLQAAHPYLSRGQVYSALAYYYDHESEVEADIERRRQFVEDLRVTHPTPSELKARAEAWQATAQRNGRVVV